MEELECSQDFPHYNPMGALCCHGNQSSDTIWPKTLCSQSPISNIPLETNSLYQNDTSFSEPVNDYIYDLSTLFDQSFETNVQYTNLTIDNNVHELSTENNVHDSTCSSMSAKSMLNLGLGKKGFKMGHLNVQGIQSKIEQIDLLLNCSRNDIQLFGLSESKLNDSHTSNFFNIKKLSTFP